MNIHRSSRSLVVLVACGFLAGCFGNGSSSTSAGAGGGAGSGGGGAGSGGGGGSLTAYETAFNAASQTHGPTQTRLTNTATYSGQVKVLTGLNVGNADEAVVGDLEMAINFDANSNPITATVDNLEGEVDGTQTTVAGTLSTANATNQINTITESQVNIPGQGASTFTGMSVGLEGTLSDPTGNLSGEALMTMQGNFVGPDGESVFGANSVGIRPTTGPDIIVGGTFYGNRN